MDGIFEVCGVLPEKIRTISSAVDKLDKMAWADVKKEMTEEKGLAEASADKIGEYVKHKGKFICASKSVRQFMSVVHHRWPGAARETKKRRAPHGKCTREIGH